MSGMSLRVVPVTTLDPSRAAEAAAWHDLYLEVARADMGDDDDAWSIESRRVREAGPNWDYRFLALVDDDGRTVAGGDLAMPLRENLELALVNVVVHPERRRRGHGTTVHDALLDIARSEGRTTVLAETTGRLDGDDPGEGFVRHHGFSVAQTVHRNDLDLAAATPDGEIAPGTTAYVIETAVDEIPETWLEDRAHLQRRMSTDVPLGELPLEEEDWDVERMRGEYAATRSSGRRTIESVARHVETGQIVALTQVQVPISDPGLAYQQDTLVLREHRGHGLGAALKAANQRALREASPQTRTLRTWNAVENTPMIAVNEALGYRTSATMREWQRHIT